MTVWGRVLEVRVHQLRTSNVSHFTSSIDRFLVSSSVLHAPDHHLIFSSISWTCSNPRR